MPKNDHFIHWKVIKMINLKGISQRYSIWCDFVKTHLYTSCELLLHCIPLRSQVIIQSAPLIFLPERSKVLSLKLAMRTTSCVWILSSRMSNNIQKNRSPYMEHNDFYVNEIPFKQCTIFIFQDFYNLWQTIILIGYKTRYEVLCIATALNLDLSKSSCSRNAISNIHQVNRGITFI